MIVSLLLYSLFASPKSVVLTPEVPLAALPDDAAEFIRVPWDGTIDEKGNVYLLDLAAHTVFMWDASGTYKGNFGKQGQGPGELMLGGQNGGPQASINVVGDEVIVYDGGLRLVNRYKKDGTFIRAESFKLPNGRTEAFRILDDGNFLIHHRLFNTEPPLSEIGIFKPDGSQLKSLFKAPDTSWRMRSDNKRGVVIIGYSEGSVLHYDQSRDRILLAGDTAPEFQVFSQDGKELEKVTMKIPRVDVSQADKDAFNEQGWIKNNDFLTADFPEKHPYFSMLFPDGDRGYLVTRVIAYYNDLHGYYVDAKGRTLGRLKYRLGEGGAIFGANGRILVVETDEEGEYNLFISKVELQNRS
ncbi:hypothetical protein SCOR_11390 [Sulfidibacter corallicola]|uniref:6-bladed beta-propeller n=1 Tax=Sulfidibacter corallicola TaxID=2818388 RepID=A0A8A4TGY6_SULCO|nr:hypothetical protein [Sulfidibacter corallicola]QTD48061.1 hypothetical protein J3U87_20955 [Sulfidibacter corallicola]